MAKKWDKMLKWVPIVAAVLGLVAVVMIFVGAVSQKVLIGDPVVWNGLQVVFGYSETSSLGSLSTTVEFLKFSFMNLLPYLLVIAGIVLCVLSFLGKGNSFFAVIAAALFIVAAVFFFMTTVFTIPANVENIAEYNAEAYTLAAGPIVAGICSILAGLVSVTPTVLSKVMK